MKRTLTYLDAVGEIEVWVIPEDASMYWHDGMVFVRSDWDALGWSSRRCFAVPINRLLHYEEKS